MKTRKNRTKRTAAIDVAGIGSYEVRTGQNLREALRREGVYIDGTCSDNGTCGRCVVRVVRGNTGRPAPQESELIGIGAPAKELRLACRIKVTHDLVISIDPEQLVELDHTGRLKEVFKSPLWRPELINSDGDGFGAAVDIGTTSVSSSLLGLSDKRLLDLRTSANPQLPWGGDIISRLGQAASDPETADRLCILVWETIRDQLRSLCRRTGVSGGRIKRMAIVGNSAMHHLSLGLPVMKLLSPPYAPADVSSRTLAPKDLPVDIGVSDSAAIYFPPLIGGYAGSDVVASLLAASHSSSGRGALVDVGTNTEIIVSDGKSALAATAPSGPAFEGGHISSGMRAEEGAVWKLDITGDDLVYEVIGGGRARGICGTGMIDALSAMLRRGILDRTGLIKAGSHPLIRDNVFMVDSAGPVALTGQDIETLQKAKAAISAAFTLLLSEMGWRPELLERVYIAGAFGSRLNINSAVDTGLLPKLPAGTYALAGNTALVGASMMLLSEKLHRRAEELGRSARHFDLAGTPEFEEAFIDALYFPAV